MESEKHNGSISEIKSFDPDSISSTPLEPKQIINRRSFNPSDQPNYSSYPSDIPQVSFNIEERSIHLYSDSLKNISLSFKIESSISVMNEGPHCDLDEWYHGYTDWQMLRFDQYVERPTSVNYYIFEFQKAPWEYDPLPFPILDMRVIRSAVRNKCAPFWSDRLKGVKTPYDYPSGVLPSAFIYKVMGTNVRTGKKETYYLRIPQAMGC